MVVLNGLILKINNVFGLLILMGNNSTNRGGTISTTSFQICRDTTSTYNQRTIQTCMMSGGTTNIFLQFIDYYKSNNKVRCYEKVENVILMRSNQS